MRRLAVLVLFDESGVVDEYKYFLMQSLKEAVDEFYIICNGTLAPGEEERVRQYACSVYQRENTGFDAAAYRECILQHIGREHLQNFDELILLNDTVFGPIHDLSEMFQAMDMKEIDFWGITQHSSRIDGDNKSLIPRRYIQSYFLVFRKSILQSDAFWTYWEDYDVERSSMSKRYLLDAFSIGLTEHFEQLGFSWDTYVKAKEYESQYLYCQYQYIGAILARKYRNPFVKKRNFTFSELHVALMDDTTELLKYIQKETQYDTRLIWKSLLRTCNLNDLHHSLRLNYVIDEAMPDRAGDDVQGIKIAAIVLQSCDSSWENSLSVNLAGGGIDMKIVPVSCHEFMETLLSLLPEYDYICILNDKFQGFYAPKIPAQISYRNLVMQSLLQSPGHIRQVISLFKENECLGLLAPPYPVHGTAYAVYCNFWKEHFGAMKTLMKTLGMTVPCHKDKVVFANGYTAWVRADSLRWLMDYREALCLPLMEYFLDTFFMALPYISQQGGYHAGTCCSKRLAEMYLSASSDTLLNFLQMNSSHAAKPQSVHHIRQKLLDSNLVQFCRSCDTIYIFGSGMRALKFDHRLKRLKIKHAGFLVSDGRAKQDVFCDKEVLYASQVDIESDTLGIVVSVDEKYEMEVREYLEGLHAKHIYYEI